MHSHLPAENNQKNLIDIRGFIETSFLDWDGKITSVVFVAGCNFRCPFCQNAPLVLHPAALQAVTTGKIETFLLEHKDFIDGVVVSGGEPTLQKNLPAFMQHAKSPGLLTKLDTNGTNPQMVKDLIGQKLVDFVAMDIKAPLNEKYNKAAGVAVNLADLSATVRLLLEGKVDYEFRLTVVPTLIGEAEIEEIGRELAGAKKFVLQQFVPENCLDQNYTKIKPFEKSILQSYQLTLKQYIGTVVLRGI
jgi:pyruvate formate lyase activating enzyme